MFDELLQTFYRLHAAERYFPIGDEGGHSAEAQLLCFPLIREHVLEGQIVIKRRSQVVTVNSLIGREVNEYVGVADVLAALEEGVKERVVILPELAGAAPSARLRARGASAAVRAGA